MSTVDTALVHEPWCTAHLDADEAVGPRGWCATATEVHGVRLEIATNVDEADGGAGVEFYAETWVSPAQAVDVAARAIEAAGLAAGRGPSTATVHRNLVQAIGSAGPLELDAVEAIANLLGVSVDDLFRD